MQRLIAIALFLPVVAACGVTRPKEAEEDPAGRPVVASPADETSPTAGPGWLAWTCGSTPAEAVVLELGVVELRRSGGPARPISEPGVLSAAGGGDERTVVIQEVRGGRSDLKLYDVARGTLREPPRGVNTRAWEWRGEISGRWLMFGRIAFERRLYQVVLHDLATGRERVLAAVSGHGAYAEPGQLNGRYAVWASCPDNVCTLYRLHIGDRKPLMIPAPRLYQDVYDAPSVTPAGVVYYAEGRQGCGWQVRIMRYLPGRLAQRVAALPPGYDLRFTTAVDDDGVTRVVYDRVRCASKRFDLYEIEDRLASPPAVSPPSTGMTAPVR